MSEKKYKNQIGVMVLIENQNTKVGSRSSWSLPQTDGVAEVVVLVRFVVFLVVIGRLSVKNV